MNFLFLFFVSSALFLFVGGVYSHCLFCFVFCNRFSSRHHFFLFLPLSFASSYRTDLYTPFTHSPFFFSLPVHDAHIVIRSHRSSSFLKKKN